MKKFLLIMLLSCALYGVFAQNVYVRASGDDNNDGLSEERAVKSFDTAVTKAYTLSRKIVVIGTLNLQSEGYGGILNKWSYGALFRIADIESELIITGKPNAEGLERAVIANSGSDAAVIFIENSIIRFEHIEISGGNGDYGFGIEIVDNARITLGQGAVVKDNELSGVIISNGTCIIDGGEIRGNQNSGVIVYERSSLILRSGSIRNNISSGSGGGVFIAERGSFTMTGGIISGNSAAMFGGGVLVRPGGRFDQSGGTISGNTASQGANPNIYRSQGSLGSNL